MNNNTRDCLPAVSLRVYARVLLCRGTILKDHPFQGVDLKKVNEDGSSG